MADLTVAKTILEQLGGHRFIAMTGAKSFIGYQQALIFRLPGKGGYAKQGINRVGIELAGDDTYTVEFSRARGAVVKVLATEKGIYADQLREVFTRATGLHTSLGIPAAEARKFDNRHED